MPNLKEWQEAIRQVCIEKGFTWTPAEIDTMLLRIISELAEASEAARDIPIKRKVKLHITITNDEYPCGHILGYYKSGGNSILIKEDGTFNEEYISRLLPDKPIKVEISGKIIEEFETNDEIAEELADTFIRLADTAEVLKVNLAEAVMKKYEKNIKRPPRHGRGRK